MTCQYYADVALDRTVDNPHFVWRQVYKPHWGQEAWDPKTRRWISCPWLCCFIIWGEIGSEPISKKKAIATISRWSERKE